MLQVLDPDDHPPAYRVPWRVDNVHETHPFITNDGRTAVDFVRVFVDSTRFSSETQFWGQMLPGETAELCLCDHDPDDMVVTVGWIRPETGVEYVWRFVV